MHILQKLVSIRWAKTPHDNRISSQMNVQPEFHNNIAVARLPHYVAEQQHDWYHFVQALTCV